MGSILGLHHIAKSFCEVIQTYKEKEKHEVAGTLDKKTMLGEMNTHEDIHNA